MSLFSSAQESSLEEENSIEENIKDTGDVSMVPMEFRRAFVQNRDRMIDIQRNIKKIFDEADKAFVPKIKGKSIQNRLSSIEQSFGIKKADIGKRRRRKRINVFERLYALSKEEEQKAKNADQTRIAGEDYDVVPELTFGAYDSKDYGLRASNLGLSILKSPEDVPRKRLNDDLGKLNSTGMSSYYPADSP